PGVGVEDPVDLGVGELAAVALGDDHLDCVVLLAHGCRPFSRSSGPKASGSTSVIGRTPRTVITCSSGPPCSHSSCRQRPQGMITSPSPSTHTKWISRPPPVACNEETSPHSAHSVTP